jgi:uncharacterized protein
VRSLPWGSVVFEWDDGNRPKVAAHGLTVAEVEEAMADLGQLPLGGRLVGSERREGIIGRTGAERVIVVIYTLRDGRFRVVTAYPGTARHRRAYREANQ